MAFTSAGSELPSVLDEHAAAAAEAIAIPRMARSVFSVTFCLMTGSLGRMYRNKGAKGRRD